MPCSMCVEHKRWREWTGCLERDTLQAFLKLPAPQRKLIREVTLSLGQVQGVT